MHQEIKDSFVRPERAVVHWDGKTLVALSPDLKNHIVVMISGDAPHTTQGKFISVKELASGRGVDESDEVIAALIEWGLQNCTCGMCFDTTNSNTGWLGGAAKLVEDKLGRPLLWLPCRHHIGELFIGAAWVVIFGNDKSPEVIEYKNFQSAWNSLDKTKITLLKPNKYLDKSKRDQVVSFCQSALERGTARDDYKECLELVLVVLGAMPKNFTFKKPGPCHKVKLKLLRGFLCKYL